MPSVSGIPHSPAAQPPLTASHPRPTPSSCGGRRHGTTRTGCRRTAVAVSPLWPCGTPRTALRHAPRAAETGSSDGPARCSGPSSNRSPRGTAGSGPGGAGRQTVPGGGPGTVAAVDERRVVIHCAAAPGMAFPAFDARVRAAQGEARSGMFLHAEPRGLPSVLGVARRALSVVATGELPLMPVFMAVAAKIVRDLHAKVFGPVTLPAAQSRMPAAERKGGPAVIKRTGDPRPLPSPRCVTLLAAACKRATVWIGVAGDAIFELHKVPVLCMTAQGGDRLVAPGAGHLLVPPCEREPRRAVGKTRSRLPRLRRVAPPAILSEAAVVFISYGTRCTSRPARRRWRSDQSAPGRRGPPA